MIKICVWYVVNGELEYLCPSLELMRSYDWVDSIIVLDTGNVIEGFDDPIEIADTEDKTLYVIDHSFGEGFDLSIENGGFDEVKARNRAIEIAEISGADWLLQCDADEFYTYDLIKEIEIADKQGFDALNIECIHAISLDQAYFPKASPKDQHRRAWRNGLGIKYIYNPDIPKLYKTGKSSLFDHGAELNLSKHCIPTGYKKVKNVNGNYHIHCHYLFGKKKSKNKWVETDEIGLKTINSDIFPDIYKKIVEKESNKMPFSYDPSREFMCADIAKNIGSKLRKGREYKMLDCGVGAGYIAKSLVGTLQKKFDYINLIGLEIYEKYIKEPEVFNSINYHNLYTEIKIANFQQYLEQAKKNQYKIIIFGDSIEHLLPDWAEDCLANALRVSKEYIYISTTFGRYEQEPSFGNEHERHYLFWTKENYELFGAETIWYDKESSTAVYRFDKKIYQSRAILTPKTKAEQLKIGHSTFDQDGKQL